MRILGAVLIIAAATLFGAAKAAAGAKRAECLGAVVEMLRYIRSELSSAQTPLPEIFFCLLQQNRPETGAFLEKLTGFEDRSFSERWAEAISSCTLDISALQAGELSRLGQYLGRFPAQEQCAALDGCIEHLEAEYELSKRAARQGEKLWTGLGLAAGLMLATVLI